jgi:hypothetical protein
MKKQKTQPAQENIWDDAPITPEVKEEVIEKKEPEVTKPTKPQAIIHTEFDIEGLQTDFPTAKELERFVYDETGIVLNLKGRANTLKYQIAMDVLNGKEVDDKFIGSDNPYVEKAEMIPTEELKPVPDRDKSLPNKQDVQNAFYSPFIPHPDDDMRAQDKKVDMIFRKYNNGMISYECIGPLEEKPFGEKMDKFGRIRPEIIKWVDPRTGEQVAVREDGTLTPQGKKLRALMQTKKVNNTNQWEMWVDREFISTGDFDGNNVWDLK